MTSNTVKENSMITKKDLNKVALRSLSMEWSWNYERQANLPYCYALIPIINKLYKTDEERAEALKRHLVRYFYSDGRTKCYRRKLRYFQYQ